MKAKSTIRFLFLALSLLACAWGQKMGALRTDGTPVPFDSIGEKPPEWAATVDPGEKYELTIRALNGENHFIRISVFDHEVSTHSVETVLAEKTEYSDVEVQLTFVAPPSGKIEIYVDPGLGDYGENLGQFTIQLQKLG